MDFLVLLPGNRHVVLEVDGMQHYTRNAGAEPDSAKYATAMAGDRDLKFCGYEVFRFGHDELRDRDGARPVVTEFLCNSRGSRGRQHAGEYDRSRGCGAGGGAVRSRYRSPCTTATCSPPTTPPSVINPKIIPPGQPT
jgi:very-short-patch-repair endonuclease